VFQPVPDAWRSEPVARELVLALGAAFENLQAMDDGVFDALLVARLEAAARTYSSVPSGDHTAAARSLKQNEQAIGSPFFSQRSAPGFRHGLAQIREKGPVEMRLAAGARVGVGVAAIEVLPVGVPCCAGPRPNRNPTPSDASFFLS